MRPNLLFLLLYTLFKTLAFSSFSLPGIRTLHPDGNPGSTACGQWNGSRLHFCHSQTPTHDHQWNGQSTDPNMPQLTRFATTHWPLHGPAHECHRLRGDRPHLPGVRVGEHGRHKGEVQEQVSFCRPGINYYLLWGESSEAVAVEVECIHLCTCPHSPVPMCSATIVLVLKSHCLVANGSMVCSVNLKKKRTDNTP